MIARGRIVAEGDPATLAGRDRMQATIRFTLPEGAALPDALRAVTVVQGRSCEIVSGRVTKDVHDLTDWALSSDVALEDLRVDRPSLEDVYLELTSDESGEP